MYASTARLVAIVARAIYVVVIAKQLGPELYGLFNYGLSWYLLFLPLGIIGIDGVIVREIGRRAGGAAAVVENSLMLRVASSVLAAIACLVIGLWFDGTELVRNLMWIFAVALVGRALAAWSNAVFRGSEASQFVLGHEIFFRLLDVVLGLVLLFHGYGLVALAGVHAACWLAQGFVSLGYVRRRFFARTSLPSGGMGPRQLIVGGLPFVVWALISGWLQQGPLVLWRNLYGDGVDLGQLALAVQIYLLVGSVVAELGGAAIPVLTRSVAREDGKTRRFGEAALRVAWLLSGLLTIGAVTLGSWLLDLFFGTDYGAVGPLLPWTTLLLGLHFCIQALWGLQVARAQYRTVIAAAAGGAAVFSLGFAPAVAWFGLHGAFATLAMGYLILLAAQLHMLKRTDALDWRAASLRPLVAVGFALLLTVLLLPLGRLPALVVGLVVLAALSLWLDVVSPAQVRRVLAARSR